MEGTSAAGGAGASGAGGSGGAPDQQQQRVVERLNPAVQQQLNLQSVKARAISLYKTISRILEEFDAFARANVEPKWQDALGQFSMVNMELFNIMEDVKKVSKAFVVHPKFVNAENATILPVMLSSKSLPEMEAEHNNLREQLLQGMQHLPENQQIEKLRARIDMIGAACDSAEKIIADMRKAYGLGTRQGPAIAPTLDKAQAAKIHEQEKLLRAAVNTGQGLQIPADQRQLPATLPKHLQDVLIGNSAQGFADSSGILPKNTPPLMSSNTANSQGSALQAAGAQFGRSVPSPSGGATTFDNTTTSPLPYANSPRSGTNMMNAPSPQQQQLQQQQQQQQQQMQQQRQKMMQQLPHQQQLLAQQQYRQSSTQGLGQGQLPQLHDMQSQAQKFQAVQHQMQYSQPLAHQQFQSRQLPSGQIPHTLGQSQVNQLTQGNQLRNHLNQYAGANSALYNTAQSSSNSQMIPNISAAMASQSLLPRMQFALPGELTQRNHASQMLSDQMFSMGATNPGSMMPVQQQQQQQQTLGAQGGFGSMAANVQNLQSGVLPMQNTSQIPNFQQQRQQNQQNQQ